MADHQALEPFSPPVRAWFSTTFEAPTEAQVQAWPAIAAGDHTLVLAPTGSGKTLTSFLWGIDRLMTTPPPEDERARTHRTRVLYISPLRALAVDIDKNLRAPLAGVALAAERMDLEVHVPEVGIRTGDTPPDERRRLVRRPPDLLITTPESLYLMLTSAARDTLSGVEAVIVDEIHAMVPTKRGSHLALSLERLEEVVERPFQRIGLSATQRPLEEVAAFLGGVGDDGAPRPVTVVDAGVRKELDLEVVVPVEDLGALGSSGEEGAGTSIWPAIHPRLLDLVRDHRSTLVFVNSRRLAERLSTRLNELDAEDDERSDQAVGRGDAAELVMAHHGSLSRERRLIVEDELKSGRLRGLVATSSLELGIDMGAVDLVVLVESPGTVASGLQRVGRAGHTVGVPSKAKLFPKHLGDLLEMACVVERMHEGAVESTRYPRNPLDVLAQQIVAMCALDEVRLDDLARVVRRAAPFTDLSDELLHNVLDLLSGRYPSEELAELRPRIVWDRAQGTLRGRAGAQRLAVTNPGTIPDRGLFGVHLPDGTRVGELDEEMVYESRTGETFLLGASTWQIQEITFDRVIVTPAPGQPGKMPFWHGDGVGRPLELGRAVGEMTRRLRGLPPDQALEELSERSCLDPLAARNLLAYLEEQAEATGAVPDDSTVVVERFRDELGDWRICVLSPFGARVHAPWGMALRVRLAERWGTDPEVVWTDDGIVIRLPEAVDELPLDELLMDPDEVEALVVAELPNTALFVSRFRESAARALLLPRRRPDRRTPLWQQRQRAAHLLSVASRFPDFPILLEATREVLHEQFDLAALREVLGGIAGRSIRVVTADTDRASPFARSLLFAWIAVFMYEGDTPLAERRAAALTLDRELLADLLGTEELRDLLDPEVLADLEMWLQRLSPERMARDADELHDVLRELGPLSTAEVEARCVGGLVEGAGAGATWLAELAAAMRVIEVVVADEARWAVAEDAAVLRDALGVALPPGLPSAFTESRPEPLVELVGRHAATHGPFRASEVAERLGATDVRVQRALAELSDRGRVVRGEFRPGGAGTEWCDDGVLRRLRGRSLARLRHEVEPVDHDALARFVPLWQGVGGRGTGPDALAEALSVLQGAAVPASVLEADVLPARLSGYRPTDLDGLLASGEVVWVGAGPIGSGDGRVRLLFRSDLPSLLPDVADDERPAGPVHDALRDTLGRVGASFWPDLVAGVHAAGADHDQAAVLDALWDLVWAGEVTNDVLAPLRAFVAGGRSAPSAGGRRRAGARPTRGRLPSALPPTGAGRWSLVSNLSASRPPLTERLHTQAMALLARHGILTREAVLGEGVAGGFAGLYPVLRALEDRGTVRRGYFVSGLGAAQFALPGAVDRLRSLREPASGDDHDPDPVVLAATDPAQPYGSTLPWPPSGDGRPARTAGAHVVLVDGEACAHLTRGARRAITFPAAERHPRWVEAFPTLVARGRLASVQLATVDGEPPSSTPWAEALESVGFQTSYRGLTLHRRRRS